MSFNQSYGELPEQYPSQKAPCYPNGFLATQQMPQHFQYATSQPVNSLQASNPCFNMGMCIDVNGRIVPANVNSMVYQETVNGNGYMPQIGIGYDEDHIHKPKGNIRASDNRGFIPANGEHYVVTQISDMPMRNGKVNLNEGVKKRKRIRTAFTDAHIKQLEDEYAINRYLDQQRRQAIARSLNLMERTVKVWFQNRRMKEKKMLQESSENSGDEELNRINYRGFRSMPPMPVQSAYPHPHPPAYVPQMPNHSWVPNYNMNYGMGVPPGTETGIRYPQIAQPYHVNPNVTYNGQYNGIGNGLSSVAGNMVAHNENVKNEVPKVEAGDAEYETLIVMQRSPQLPYSTDEETNQEVTCSFQIDSETLSESNDSFKKDYVDLDTFNN